MDPPVWTFDKCDLTDFVSVEAQFAADKYFCHFDAYRYDFAVAQDPDHDCYGCEVRFLDCQNMW